MKMYLASICILVSALMLCSISTAAQGTPVNNAELDKNIELMRKDVRSEKKKIIAMNVPLTETEATKFWPLYDQYTTELSKHNDGIYTLIKEYAANQRTLTDEQALSVLKRWNGYQIDIAQTRQKYVPMFEKIISGKKTALFYQIDRRLWLTLDIQIASEVPLVIQQ